MRFNSNYYNTLNNKIVSFKSFLSDNTRSKKIAIIDIDGTIYRGHISRVVGHYADGDLLFHIMPAILKNVVLTKKCILPYFKIVLIGLIGRVGFKIKFIARETVEKHLVYTMHEEIVPKIPDEYFKMKANECIEYLYPGALHFCKMVYNAGYDIFIVSKAHEIIVMTLIHTLTKIGICATGLGNPVDSYNEQKIYILTKEDKYFQTKKILIHYKKVGKVLIVGNAEDDLGVVQAANDIVKEKKNVYVICRGNECKKLIKMADIVVKDFRPFN